MDKKSKRYRQALEVGDLEKKYTLSEAIKVLYKMPQARFDETVKIVAHLDVDPKQTDQTVRGSVGLPHGSGQTVKVLAFTENPEEAKIAGAEYVGMDDLIKRIEEGWMDFDVVVATSSAMKKVRSLAKILGPRGLMPNPKNGTVSDDIGKVVKEVKAGRVDFKMDKGANVAIVIGKRSFGEKEILENARVAIEALEKSKSSAIKGNFVESLSICLTMSPSVKIDLKGLQN